MYHGSFRITCQSPFPEDFCCFVKALDVSKQIKQSESGQMKELEEVRALYQKEALQRKLLYNQVRIGTVDSFNQGFFLMNN